MPSAVDRVRFARFVERTLAAARARDLTDVDIERATGIRASTFHRWRRGEVAPTVDKVRQFCAGLGVPASEALAALGLGPRAETPPEPLDPDVAALLRRLGDPATSEATRTFIRQLLRTLADMPEQPRPRGRKEADAVMPVPITRARSQRKASGDDKRKHA